MRSEASMFKNGNGQGSISEDFSKLYQVLYSGWRRCCQNWTSTTLLQLRRDALKLYSFAKNNGFGDISENAKTFELRLRCLERKPQLTPKDERLLVQNLATLKHHILALHIHSDIVTLHPAVRTIPPRVPQKSQLQLQKKLSQSFKASVALLDVEMQIARQISLALHNAGYIVKRFDNSQQLQQAMQAQSFDLVLMEASLDKISLESMPIVEGFIANKSKKIPVIMLSAYSDLTTRLAALRAGVKEYLTTPVQEKEILVKIETILSKNRQDRIRVLAIDDDSMLTEHYETALDEAGFNVKTINDPLLSLQEIEQFKPDVITLDYHMPNCNGLEVAEILSGDPRYAIIPIVFMVDPEETGQHKNLMRHYAKSVFEKPVDINKLTKSLSAIGTVTEENISALDTIDVFGDKSHLEDEELETSNNKVTHTTVVSKLEKTNEPSKKIVDALRSRAFELAFQPIVRPDGDEHIFEVLTRLKDEDGELHTADTFMPFIDKEIEDGSYYLDRWVIENAFQTLEKTTGRGSAEFSIVIKLSPNLKQIERLMPFIYNVVSNSRLRGMNRIYFSLPERALASNTVLASNLINSLHTSGCGFVLEQCNASEESIELINIVDKIEFIKLDRGVCGARAGSKDTQRKIGKLRSALGSKGEIIAGVVEDARTFAYFWQLDIRLFQGFFIHRPHPHMQYQNSDELFS